MTKVLVVEDDKFLRDMISRKLDKEGYEVVQAVDGEMGEQKAKSEKPDIILLDLILPGIDGFEVLERIKSDPEISNVPVIILSNLGQKSEVERGFGLGAVDFLIKAHWTPPEIVKKVREIV